MFKYLVAIFLICTFSLRAQEASLDSLLRVIEIPVDSQFKADQVQLLGQTLQDLDKDYIDD